MIPVETIKKILIVQTGSMEEMVFTLPFIDAIKNHFPHWKVYLLISKDSQPLAAELNGIEGIFITEASSIEFGTFSWMQLMLRLRKESIDVALHLNPTNQPKLRFLLANIPFHVCSKNKILYRSFRYNRSFIHRDDATLHDIQSHLNLLNALSIDSQSESIDISLPYPAVDTGRHWLKLNGQRNNIPLLTLTFKTNGTHQPSPEKYAAYINDLRLKIDLDVCVIVTTENDSVLAARLTSSLQTPVILAKSLPFKTQIDILSESSICVGVDSGLLRVAAGLKRPVVAIFPTRQFRPLQSGPWQSPHRIISESSACSHPCSPKKCVLSICTDALDITKMVTASLELLEGAPSPDSPLDTWFKLSHSILITYDDETENAATTLKNHLTAIGFNSVMKPINSRSLYRTIIRNNVTIIHNLTQKRRHLLDSYRHLASTKTTYPQIIIHEKKNTKTMSKTETIYRSYCV